MVLEPRLSSLFNLPKTSHPSWWSATPEIQQRAVLAGLGCSLVDVDNEEVVQIPEVEEAGSRELVLDGEVN